MPRTYNASTVYAMYATYMQIHKRMQTSHRISAPNDLGQEAQEKPVDADPFESHVERCVPAVMSYMFCLLRTSCQPSADHQVLPLTADAVNIS